MLDSHFRSGEVVAISGGNVTDVDVWVGNDVFEISVRFFEVEVLGELVSQALVVVLGNGIDLEQRERQRERND